MPLITSDQIERLMLGRGETIPPSEAKDLADQIRACGGLDEAIAGAVNDEAQSALSQLLQLRAVIEESADPSLRARRLRAAAAVLDDRAERLMAEVAEWHGRAAHRAHRGEDQLAAQFRARADAAEGCAMDLCEQAFRKRLAAAQIEARVADAHALTHIAAA